MLDLGYWFPKSRRLHFEGNSLLQTLTLGGVDCDGWDASNELTYTILDAVKSIRTSIPVIPGWNDTQEEMKRLAAFAKSLSGPVESVQLLPFHATADFKYQVLGRKWSFEGIGELPADRLAGFRSIFESHGLFYREADN